MAAGERLRDPPFCSYASKSCIERRVSFVVDGTDAGQGGGHKYAENTHRDRSAISSILHHLFSHGGLIRAHGLSHTTMVYTQQPDFTPSPPRAFLN